MTDPRGGVMVAAVTFLETLRSDAENLVESDLPSAQEVRAVVAALVKRVEGLIGLVVPTEPPNAPAPAPAEPAPEEPAPVEEPAGAPTEEPLAEAAPAETTAEEAKAARKAELEAELAALEAQP